MNSEFLNKKVALYINFDTNEEYEKEKSNIKKHMIDFCNENNIEDYKEYIDIGFIGKNRRRSRYETLLRHIDKNYIDAVVVYKLNHLGRHINRLNKVIKTLYDKKTIIYSLQEKQGLINFNEKEFKEFKEFSGKYLKDIVGSMQSKIQKEIYKKKYNTEFDISSYDIKEYRKNIYNSNKVIKSIENEL